jgi:hypothetical protein
MHPPDSQPVRVLAVLTRMGTDKYPRAQEEWNDIFRRQMPEVVRDIILVDNALPREHEEVLAPGVTLIGGDNSSWEFSAFDRALAHAGDRVFSYDFVHLATSAFNTLYVAYLERFTTALLMAARGRPACIGHIDCYNEPIGVLGYYGQHWVRSCFLFVPPGELRALGSLVSAADGAPFFSKDPAHPFRSDAPLSPNYQRYIHDWLTGQDVGQGVRWHTRYELSAQTLPVFEAKARMILNEHLLGLRLRALGCASIDVTWLSAMLRERPPEEIDWQRSWRRQLAERDRDRLLVA